VSLLASGLVSQGTSVPEEPARIKVLFLGDNGPHRPAERFRQLQPVLATRGIDLTYTDKVDALAAQTLGRYDGLILYANVTSITPAQEQALLEFVANGKGFIPIHCASYCFHNSPRYIELVGAQFQRHGAGTFRTTVAAPDHPVMTGFRGFESWDETYVHTKHNEKDRTVLEYRAERDGKEPWTWVRTHGKGRVFYTAWGHDERTWGHPGFQNLVERGVRWAVGRDPGAAGAYAGPPALTPRRADVRPFDYVPAKVPFYPAGKSWGTTAEPLTRMQKPLEPAESLKHFVTPVGFEVKLFASEPQLGGKPIAMNWDERGRLWVAVTVDYPNEKQPEGRGRDRIVVCEDTDGDGVADKFTVFADRLSIPTGLAFARGGVIVHQAPHTLFLKDTDGEGVADERRVLFTGWGTHDTHAGPSNLQYGFDNWYYGIVGYSGFDGSVGGERHKFGQGFYRFRLPLPPISFPQAERGASSPFPHEERGVGGEGIKLEFLRSTDNNSWGVGFSEDGQLFGSTANGNPSVHVPIPNRFYEPVRGWSPGVLPGIAGNAPIFPITDKVRQIDFHSHFTAAAGHAVYSARTYPREYWNRTAFVAESTGHLVATFELRPDGATLRSRNAWNLLASDDEWSAPIMAEVGPDGNVWVIDWYNYIVQHNPTPPGYQIGKGNAYETDLRDKKHGRIYRVIFTGATPSPPFSLAAATPEKLVAALKHDNLFWRRHAQRLLVERGGRDVVAALIKAAGDLATDEIGLNAGVVHALWTLHGLGALDGSDPAARAAAVAALRHPSAGVRRNAAQVLPRDEASAMALLDASLLEDTDAQVRLATLLALAEMPASAAAANALAAALDGGALLQDRWLSDAATSAAAAHADAFLRAAAARSWQETPGGVIALVERVADHHARGVPATTVRTLLEALAEANGQVATAILSGLARGWPKHRPPAADERTEKALVRLLPKLSPAGRVRLVTLATRWGSPALRKHAAEIAGAFLAQVREEKESDAVRAAAAAQLVDFRKDDAEAVRQLLELLTPRTAPALAQGLLEAVAHSEAPAAGAAVAERMGALTPAVRPAALRMLLSRADWAGVLLDALDRGTVQLAELTLDQKQALAAHPDRRAAERAKKLLARGGALPDADRQKVVEEWMPLTQRTGDAGSGKLVFKAHCAKCHTHGGFTPSQPGERGGVGPDLSGVAVHTKAHLLVEILDPSRSVEGNYRPYTVATKGGQVLTGLLAAESKTAIELVDAEARRHTVQRDEIEELQASAKSLMPDGFEKQLKPDELVNLLEFLTRRGKYLPLPLGKVATAVSTRGMFYSPEADVERLIFDDWSPKTFEGVLFHLVDPQGDRVPNVILLHGPLGTIPPKMPRSVRMPCNAPALAVHFLSGVSGWGFPYSRKGSVSMTVRLHYEYGRTEDHPLKNGEHFADYIRRVDVPGSKFAFALRGQQVRYLRVTPGRAAPIKEIEFVKGDDETAPVVMAVTVEAPG
jgi:putative membrane-bound dehydrogenase-like protein